MWQRLRQLTGHDIDLLAAIVHVGRAAASPAVPAPEQSAPESDVLADDCEAFLAGRSVERLATAWRAIPPWAWLNAVAHATVEELRELAAGARWVDDPALCGTRVWREALTYLAGEVLSLTSGRADALIDVQASVLVPLELRLAAQPHDQRSTAPALVGAALAALTGHPSTHSKGASQ